MRKAFYSVRARAEPKTPALIYKSFLALLNMLNGNLRFMFLLVMSCLHFALS